MDSRVQRYLQEIQGKRVAVIGIGVTNTGLIGLLARHGALVTARDRREAEQLGAVAGELEAAGVSLQLGTEYLQGLDDMDIVFRTPGMQYHSELFDRLRRNGTVVTSEMEVFFELCPCRTIAITGSDGKTTTSTLIAEMLRTEGYTVHLGGNIGRALLPEIESMQSGDWAVVELSSFQLISMRPCPDIAVLTNVAPNHLDWHKDMAEYEDAKRNIYRHQGAQSMTVLNRDNAFTASCAGEVRGQTRWFSLDTEVDCGAFLDTASDVLIYRDCHGRADRILSAGDIRLPGIHNVANYLAAIAAVRHLVSDESICRVAREFGGVEHRIEFVRELDGVKWYNDSIATSPTRAIAGLKSFEQKMVIIAGGYDKKIPFEPLAPYIAEKVKLLILTGLTADKIEAAVRADPQYRDGNPVIVRAQDLAGAVRIAREQTGPGDVVSLSPACASFDSYPNFEARGRHYKELVLQL